MLNISNPPNPLPGQIVYRMLIPQTPDDDRRIAELARECPAEIDESQVSTITDDQTYRVTKSLTHESESNQLHLAHRA